MVLRQHGKLWNCEQFSLLSLFMLTGDTCLFMVCLSRENSTFSALNLYLRTFLLTDQYEQTAVEVEMFIIHPSSEKISLFREVIVKHS